MKTELTPEQIRVRCAEIDEYEWVVPEPVNCQLRGWRLKGSRWIVVCPNYANSIDAINAAVLRLSNPLREAWLRTLIDSKSHGGDDDTFFLWEVESVATASALDRARAFVAIHENK